PCLDKRLERFLPGHSITRRLVNMYRARNRPATPVLGRLTESLAGLVVLVFVFFVFPGIAFARWYVQAPQRDRQRQADQRGRQMGFPGNPGLDRQYPP